MNTSWKTIPQIAAERGIDLKAAQDLVDSANCPKVFGLHGTAYLI
jgi:hypothetical protein